MTLLQNQAFFISYPSSFSTSLGLAQTIFLFMLFVWSYLYLFIYSMAGFIEFEFLQDFHRIFHHALIMSHRYLMQCCHFYYYLNHRQLQALFLCVYVIQLKLAKFNFYLMQSHLIHQQFYLKVLLFNQLIMINLQLILLNYYCLESCLKFMLLQQLQMFYRVFFEIHVFQFFRLD